MWDAIGLTIPQPQSIGERIVATSCFTKNFFRKNSGDQTMGRLLVKKDSVLPTLGENDPSNHLSPKKVQEPNYRPKSPQ